MLKKQLKSKIGTAKEKTTQWTALKLKNIPASG
jgi:hypothetical protein